MEIGETRLKSKVPCQAAGFVKTCDLQAAFTDVGYVSASGLLKPGRRFGHVTRINRLILTYKPFDTNFG